MRQDDFVDIMKDVVPELIEQAILSSSDRNPATKRTYEDVEHSPSDSSSSSGARARVHEVLSVQECTDLLQTFEQCSSEVFMAEYLKKKMSKELKHSNNPPELQRKIDDGKLLEWQTLLSKPNAVKLHYGKAAERIRQQHPDRFIGSRFVLTRKPMEEGQEISAEDLSSFQVKGRWCLQGHLDPDLQEKAETGLLKSPTLSQLGRMTLMQVLASKHWRLQLGDIKGAFLEAGPLDEKFRPLYAHQPPGGIPGVPHDAVIEVLGNVYGQNDAPAAWFKEFSTFVQSVGWLQSKLDPCLYTLRDQGQLVGVMGVHVDDTALGGMGKVFEQSVQKLRERFPYRKWRVGEGEFCGAWYKQHDDHRITMNMQAFVDKMRAINVPKGVSPETALSDSQIRVLRAVNGSLNWLSSQSRPDLAVQTSMSQQAFPKPTVQDFRKANQAVRRAKQERALGITFSPIDLDELTVACHSDAAWANVGSHTQAGYIIGFTNKRLQDGEVSTWCPATWRSFKLSRAVSSTLAAEAQAMSVATSTVEWLLLLLAEILDGPLDVPKCRNALFMETATSAFSSNASLLKELLIKAREDGSLQHVMASLLADTGDSGFELISEGGSMSDASKRRMTSPPPCLSADRPEKELAMSGSTEDKNKVSSSPASFGMKLPTGIRSVDAWGSTLLEVGKYRSLEMSYAELASSVAQDHRAYCSWLLTQQHRVDLTAPMKDLIRYLIVRGKIQNPMEECFEGSTVRR
eukprot:s1627_g4.t1